MILNPHTLWIPARGFGAARRGVSARGGEARTLAPRSNYPNFPTFSVAAPQFDQTLDRDNIISDMSVGVWKWFLQLAICNNTVAIRLSGRLAALQSKKKIYITCGNLKIEAPPENWSATENSVLQKLPKFPKNQQKFHRSRSVKMKNTDV